MLVEVEWVQDEPFGDVVTALDSSQRFDRL